MRMNRIPNFGSKIGSDKVRVYPTIACLLAVYAGKLKNGDKPTTDAIFTMVPPFPFFSMLIWSMPTSQQFAKPIWICKIGFPMIFSNKYEIWTNWITNGINFKCFLETRFLNNCSTVDHYINMTETLDNFSESIFNLFLVSNVNLKKFQCLLFVDRFARIDQIENGNVLWIQYWNINH